MLNAEYKKIARLIQIWPPPGALLTLPCAAPICPRRPIQTVRPAPRPTQHHPNIRIDARTIHPVSSGRANV